MISDRLSHLQSQVQKYYKQLACKEEAKLMARFEDKELLQQQIDALKKELRSVEGEYWRRWQTEIAGLTIPEADAERVASELVREVEFLEIEPAVQRNAEWMTVLQEIKAALSKPGIPAAGKLKAAIPLLPGLISYEMELDTAGLLRRVFPTFCNLAEKKKSNALPNNPGGEAQRVWLVAGAIGLLSLGGGAIGLHFLQPQLSPLCLIQQCEQKTKTVTVLLAEFDGVDAKNYRVTERILQNLQDATKNYPTVKILPLKQAISQQEGKNKAQELGKNKNADIVIWGWYGKTQQKAQVSVNFEMLSAAKDYIDVGKQVQGEPRYMAVAALESFEIQVNLAEELKYLTLVTLGVSAYAADDWDNAIKQLTVALSEAKPNQAALDPAPVYLYRGNAYGNKGEYDRAIEDFNQALKLNPKLAAAFNNRGNTYRKKVEYDRAIADFNQALKLNPKLAEVFNNRGNAYGNKGEYDRAIADYNQCLKLNPKLAEAFYNRGIAYGNKGEYDHAIADFHQALLLNPKDAEAFYNRGIAYGNKGEYDRAIADFNQALLLNPKYAAVFYNRGIAYGNKGEYDRAIADFNQSLLLNPKYAAVFYNRGTAYGNKGEYDRAIADFNQALKLYPRNAAAFCNRGIAYDKKGEYDRAIADFNQSLLLYPKNALAFNNRGMTYDNKGEYDRAIADFNQALLLNPKDAAPFNNRGLAYTNKKEYDRAIADFNQSLLLYPKNALAFNNRGIAYELKGDKVKAIESYRQALAVAQDPQVKELAQWKLKELEAK